jgi:hypothetical protein
MSKERKMKKIMLIGMMLFMSIGLWADYAEDDPSIERVDWFEELMNEEYVHYIQENFDPDFEFTCEVYYNTDSGCLIVFDFGSTTIEDFIEQCLSVYEVMATACASSGIGFDGMGIFGIDFIYLEGEVVNDKYDFGSYYFIYDYWIGLDDLNSLLQMSPETSFEALMYSIYYFYKQQIEQEQFTFDSTI